MEIVPTIRLWHYPELEADEGLESWLQRCAHLYSVDRDSMLGHLLGRPVSVRERTTDLDSACSGITFPGLLPKRVSPPRTPDCGPQLDPAARGAYCPLCFECDLRVNKIPYYRHSWYSVFRTHCATHRTPLFIMPLTTAEHPQRWLPSWRGDPSAGKPLKYFQHRMNLMPMQLNYARLARRWWESKEPDGHAWRQQVDWERFLCRESGTPTQKLTGLGGVTAGELSIVVRNCSTFFGSRFPGLAQSRPVDYLGAAMSPSWLYAGRSSQPDSDTDEPLLQLEAIRNTSQRRMLISLSMRLITLVMTDALFDKSVFTATFVSEPLGHLALKGLSDGRVEWLLERMVTWPPCMRAAFSNIRPFSVHGVGYRKKTERRPKRPV